jgi:hypothetical protein
MWRESLLNELWQSSLARLGGEVVIETSARELGAFQRARAVGCATDLLRLILAYCLGDMGLRTTSAWASSVGLAELSSVALLSVGASVAPGWNIWSAPYPALTSSQRRKDGASDCKRAPLDKKEAANPRPAAYKV